MADDAEVLDWGHEEEDGVAVHGSERRTFSVDDAEDAVSLGGDEEDEFLTYQSRVPQDTVHCASSPPKSARQSRQDVSKGHSASPRPLQSQDLQPTTELTGPDQPSLPGRTLVHALPPKPVVSTVSFVHPSHPSIIEATTMASRADRDKRNGAGAKAGVYDHNDTLPPGWEVKYPRNGRGVYYYNIHTRESTWTRPTASTTREKRGERSDRRDDSLDQSFSTRNGESLMPRVGRADSGDMTYDDRHYRPGETARREERPAPSTQLIDSYVPDPYSPDHRNSRPSPPPSRTRERDPTPPPRRPVSPDGSYGDRDDAHSSHREAPPAAALSAQDRVWVARDIVPFERTRERRQRDDPPPSETDRRNPPRDTEKSSTLRPRSPTSYTRGSQESPNTTPHSSIKPSQPVSEAPPDRKSRFSQADGPAQHAHRQPESRDVGMRRARTDDVASHSVRHADNVPSSRSMSDVRGDDDTPTHPTSDAQRPGSRKRTPLPPQDEVFRPATRPASAQRGGGYPSPANPPPASVPESRHTSRVVPDDPPRDSARRSPSPPPQPGPPPAESSDRDRRRSRWSKPYVNGPSQMDPHVTHESSRRRAHDVVMDVDEVPLPRSSDPAPKQVPPRRPGLQDDVPRYPRAMLNQDNDGPSRGVRDFRDGFDSRHRPVVDDSSRFAPLRDRAGMERHSADPATSQKEPIRSAESRPPLSGSSVKLSGTNNIPIGARNKFASNAPPPSMPPTSTRRAPPVISAIDGDPVAPRRDRVNKDHERPLHHDGTTLGDRGVPTEPGRRDDVRRSPLNNNNSHALPPVEPAAPPTRPSRAALGLSRFGPPIVKENPEPVRLQTNVSTESLPSQVPEASSRATPPPLSRESSMMSFKDVAAPAGRLPHLPARPASPPRGYRSQLGDGNKPHLRPSARSPAAHDSRGDGVVAEVPAQPTDVSPGPVEASAHPIEASTCPRPPSPLLRKRPMDTYPPQAPPAPRDSRGVRSPEHPRPIVRDAEADHVARPPPPPLVREEERDRAPPPMHPERALMLQANGLPPRPPSALGRPLPLRGSKRDRHDERDYDRAEPLRGNSRGHYRSVSPVNERRRYPDDDAVRHGTGGGASLLDRLSLDEGVRVNSPSLRERVQLPSKRDREEMMLSGDLALDVEGDEYDASRRVRRRGTRVRKGRL